MATGTRFCFGVVLASLAGCGPSIEPETTIAEVLGGMATGVDIVHGTVSRGDACVHDLERLDACPDYREPSAVQLEVDWAPEGLFLSASAPAFTEFVDGEPGLPADSGYILLSTWTGSSSEPVSITCGAAAVENDEWHFFRKVAITDQGLLDAGETHEDVRLAIERGSASRIDRAIVQTLGGCPIED